MQNTRFFLAALFLAAALATPATALADGSGDQSWAGPYVGGFLGAARHEADWRENDDDWWSGTEEANSDGVYGGLLGGFNWQNGNCLYGVEADFAMTSNSDTGQLGEEYDDIEDNDLNWISTLRARGGLIRGDTLFFVTGGLAIADFDTFMTSEEYPDEVYTASGDRTGWVAGGGVERRVTENITVRAETLYHDFGSKTYEQPGDIDDTNTISNTVLTGRLAVNFFFN